jgi:hypothetical protein
MSPHCRQMGHGLAVAPGEIPSTNITSDMLKDIDALKSFNSNTDIIAAKTQKKQDRTLQLIIVYQLQIH